MKKHLVFLLGMLSISMYSQIFAPDFTYTVNAGGQVNFTNTTPGLSGSAAFYWDLGDNSGTSSLMNPSYTYSYNYTYNVSLTVYDNGVMDSVTKQVTVTTASQTASCPNAASFIAGTNGAQTQLNFPNSPAGVTVYWGDGVETYYASPTTVFHQYSLNGTYQVAAYAESIFGSMHITCDTLIQNVVVSNVPCQPLYNAYLDTVTYQIYLQSTSTGATNYYWTLNGNPVGNDTPMVQTPPLAPGFYTLCLAINGPNGCYSSKCDTFTLAYTPSCGSSVTLTPVSGQCDQYTASVSATGITSYTWYVNGNAVSTSASPTLNLSFGSTSNSSTISWQFNGSGCTDHGYTDFYNPAGFYLYLDTTTSINTWYIYPNSNQPVISELWDFGDGSTSTLQYPTHTYAVAGYYTITHTITTSNGCNYTYQYQGYFFRMDGTNSVNAISNIAVVPAPTGIKENQENHFSIFPNPSNGNFIINSLNESVSEVRMLDLTGKRLPVNYEAEGNNCMVHAEQLENGFYILQLIGKNRTTSKRVVIQK